MTDDEKKKKFEELLFKKKWAKYCKLAPRLDIVKSTVGKAPKCNIKGPKKEVTVIVDNKKKKR